MDIREDMDDAYERTEIEAEQNAMSQAFDDLGNAIQEMEDEYIDVLKEYEDAIIEADLTEKMDRLKYDMNTILNLIPEP